MAYLLCYSEIIDSFRSFVEQFLTPLKATAFIFTFSFAAANLLQRNHIVQKVLYPLFCGKTRFIQHKFLNFNY
jgi:hypothetical protein